MKIKVEPISVEQKSVLMQVMELYNYDFSIFSNKDINEYGYYGYSRIDDYWNEEGRFPFFIRVDDKIAGLVLVRSCCEYSKLNNPHNIAEFFVMQKYRRRGIGKTAAMQVFDLFRGGWEVAQWAQNVPAQKFWRSVVSDYTNNSYKEFGSLNEGHLGFTFDNTNF